MDAGHYFSARCPVQNRSLFLAGPGGVYKHLPIVDQDVFSLQWQAFLRLSCWAILDFALAYSLLVAKALYGSNFIYVGLALGVAQALFVTVAGICLYSFVRPMFYRLAPLFLVSAIAMAIFGSNQLNLAKGIMHSAYWLPPVGWIFQLLGLTDTRGTIFDLLPAVMAACLLALFPIAWKRARDFYVPTEELFAAAERAGSANPAPTLEGVAQHLKEESAEVKTAIESRQFLQPLDWEKLPFVERNVARLLNPRERLIAEFMLGGKPQWTKGLRSFLIFLGFVLGCLLLIGRLRAFGPWVSFVSMFLIFANTQAAWRGFGLPRGSGPRSPFYTMYPIGFRELMSTVIKINLARFLMLLPVLFPAAFFLIKTLNFNNGFDLLAVLKLFWLAIVLQPFAALAPVSSVSGDSQKPAFVLGALVIILTTAGCGITFFLSTNPRFLLGSGIMVTLLPWASLILYGRLFNRNRFDLIPIRTDSTLKQ